ncbi:MAG TPA: hypothetical protein VL614_00715 [Acetobacteraceae bacterium]|jgi:hypothetical protein|nr:hypothetical protein [Acetobacteraceae bacterium]
MKRGTFIAALAGPARVSGLVLAQPLRMKTLILRERPGELARILARETTRPLQLLWPDRTPAVTVFADVVREMGAASALKRNRPALARGAG